MPGHPPNYGAKLFEDAASRLGLRPYPMPVAINNLNRDGRSGCSYCGFCSSHGCPIEAKNDMRVTALRKALATGRLQIRPDSYVYRVVLGREGRAKEVEYLDAEGRQRSVAGKVIVLSCSTVDTPRLVLLSELAWRAAERLTRRLRGELAPSVSAGRPAGRRPQRSPVRGQAAQSRSAPAARASA
jgi:choline dehydrogenase-like flavoprotein